MKLSRTSIWRFAFASLMLLGVGGFSLGATLLLKQRILGVLGAEPPAVLERRMALLREDLRLSQSEEEREEVLEEIDALMGQLTRLQQEQLRLAERALREQSTRISLMVGGGILLGGGLILLAGFQFGMALSRQLRRVNLMASALAGGDLNQHLDLEAADELMELAGSLNRLVENLAVADQEITREVQDRIYAEKKALEAAKAKSAFLAHMSHEFRTPLNGILGYTQVLLMDKGLSEKNQSVVHSLKRSGESLLELINDVLDLTKIEARSMKLQQARFYLQDFLEAIRASYAEQIQLKGLEFRLEVSRELPEDILGDQVRLRQVLVNLIGNAIKFTDTGFIELQVKPEGEAVRFQVLDTGMGIHPDDQAKIFEPFVQAEAQGGRMNKGTGLGLSISTRLLEMMKSELHMESELGRGTCFWFDLPQPAREGRRLVLPNRNISGYQGARRRILLIDPGRENAATLAPLLKKIGFEIFEPPLVAQAAEDALRIRPDLVILEMHLPKADGVEVMKTMRERLEREGLSVPPFFLLTGNEHPEDHPRGLRAGASEMISKPPRFLSLLELLQRHLELEWITGGADAVATLNKTDQGIENGPRPPGPILRQLLMLARSGNVRKVKETTEAVMQQHPDCEQFCRVVLHLAGNYQINALVELLQHQFEPEHLGTHR